MFLMLSPAEANSGAEHKFYYSRTSIRHNLMNNSLEIEMRLFTDDLERAISWDEEPMRLGTTDESNEARFRVEDYIRSHFSIFINNQYFDYKFWGKETDYDITYCYFELVLPPDVSVIEIRNSVLMDVYIDQVNEIDLSIRRTTKRITLTSQWPAESISY